MVIIKLCLLALSCLFTFCARRIYEEFGERKRTKLSDLLAVLALIAGAGYVMLHITQPWMFIVVHVLLLISFNVYILFKKEFYTCKPFWFCFALFVIFTTIAFALYWQNVEKIEQPEVEITRVDILSVDNTLDDNDTIPDGVFYFTVSAGENPKYNFYYLLEDGGIKQGSISAEKCTLYFIDYDKEPYIEKVVTTYYYLDKNVTPASKYLQKSIETYNIYIPEGSVTSIHEFNLD